MKLEFDEVRRLTGPNLLSNDAGAIVDAFVEGIDNNTVYECWKRCVEGLLEELNWQESIYYRGYEGGVSLAISAPMDALYTACDVAELAWYQCAAELTGTEVDDFYSRRRKLHDTLRDERNSQLMELIAAAEQNGAPWLSDDDEFSLGMGASAEVWAIDRLPDIDSIDWGRYQRIPAAFITGTNGKSTSVRLASTIARCANVRAGVTSTDFIRVGDNILDRGDYSGPGGARILLRHPDTELAFLEVARGGILRRGLPVQKCRAALLTNIAADHLGQYGINTVPELAEAKFVVDKGLAKDGILVLNADDAELNAIATKATHPIAWFSMDADSPRVAESIANGLPAVYFRDNAIHLQAGDTSFSVAVDEITMSFGGTATYNVRNAMGVVALCHIMDFDEQSIRAGLKAFGSSAEDNPGRGNHYNVNGATVIVDFAHNQHSMRAVVEMAGNLPAKRRMAMFGHAGDRSDKDIRDLTEEVIAFQPNEYIISELRGYLRGREPWDVPKLVESYLLERGVDPDAIVLEESPVTGTRYIIDKAGPGDVILLFTLAQRDVVTKLLQAEQE